MPVPDHASSPCRTGSSPARAARWSTGSTGLPHIPPGTKKRSSDSGVRGLPTLLSNAETYAQVAIAARLGPYEYAAVGTDDEPGTVLLTVTGSARRAGRGGVRRPARR